MFGQSTDQAWELLGQLDPYWAVFTDDSFRQDRLTEAALARFLESGQEHVARIWDVIQTRVVADFQRRRVLDFGCGVGRLAIPLAKRCEEVVGVDVAQSMLAEARFICRKIGVTNVRFLRCDDSLTGVEGPFDLVHSYIVFQHISIDRGLALLKRLISRLDDNGIGVLHFVYQNPDVSAGWRVRLKRAWSQLRRWLRPAPHMQMNAYPLNSVFQAVQDLGARRIHVEFTDHGGCRGVLLFFRKCASERYIV